tara:strand:+ start:40 stop:1143 length:1104 start_codon:yes stop_codon:yes gene_type:complete
MDTTDPGINFDLNGLCEYCKNYDINIKPRWKNSKNNKIELNKLSSLIKKEGKNKDFDCIIGLSGGLDSSYAAFVSSEIMGLRPLLFHVDAGWNTDQAVGNIEKLVDGLNLDLYTEVVDWEKIKRMQVAFLKSGIPDQDLVQDGVFFSQLYKFARKYKIKYIITGSNYSTECCREPEEWGGYLGIDKILFKDIWKKHGDGKPNNLYLIDILLSKIWYQKILGMKVVYPLNLLSYEKKKAEEMLKNKFDWKPFVHKHHESRFTRFYEDFWLPKRFGYDKRKAHFSSLIMTNQMNRDEALKRISKSEMGDEFHKQEVEYVANKLDLSLEDLNKLLYSPKKYYFHFKNKRWLIKFGANFLRKIGLERRYFR